MKIALISGSQRANSQSKRVCQHINKHCLDDNGSVIDLHHEGLPMWDGDTPIDSNIKNLRQQLRDADGFIMVIPEWHGMAPAAIKNLFLWFGSHEFAHKPALLIAVSAGTGGATIINEMRTSSYKNSRILYLPEHVILRDVEALWRDDTEHVENDYLTARLDYAISVLKIYQQTLAPAREQLLEQLKDYRNGMS